MYHWAKQHISNVNFFWVDKTDVLSVESLLSERFAASQTVPGTRSHHCFIPTPDHKLRIFRVSGDDTPFLAHVIQGGRLGEELAPSVSVNDCQPGQYVACKYNNKWWDGSVLNVDSEHNDLRVSFMTPHGPAKSFGWPRRQDICWVPLANILRILKPPLTANGRQYTLERDDAHFLKFSNL